MYWKSKNSVIRSLDRYIKNMTTNNLCLSNLSYDIINQDNIDNILNDFGIGYTEIVPYKTFGEDFISKDLSYFD